MENNGSSKVAMSETLTGLDTPIVVSQIAENCVYSGFFGRLDSGRMKSLTDKMLEIIERTSNKIIIIDLSNVDIIDSAVAAHLISVGTVMNLVGVKTIFCGIKPIVAQTMVVSGVEFEKYDVVRDLKGALEKVYEENGKILMDIKDLK